jgi:hypothetical protein
MFTKYQAKALENLFLNFYIDCTNIHSYSLFNRLRMEANKMTSPNSNQRWLTQLLSIERGKNFHLSELPFYQIAKTDPERLVQFQQAFDTWIAQTHEKYVSKGATNYLRVS